MAYESASGPANGAFADAVFEVILEPFCNTGRSDRWKIARSKSGIHKARKGAPG